MECFVARSPRIWQCIVINARRPSKAVGFTAFGDRMERRARGLDAHYIKASCLRSLSDGLNRSPCLSFPEGSCRQFLNWWLQRKRRNGIAKATPFLDLLRRIFSRACKLRSRCRQGHRFTAPPRPGRDGPGLLENHPSSMETIAHGWAAMAPVSSINCSYHPASLYT